MPRSAPIWCCWMARLRRARCSPPEEIPGAARSVLPVSFTMTRPFRGFSMRRYLVFYEFRGEPWGAALDCRDRWAERFAAIERFSLPFVRFFFSLFEPQIAGQDAWSRLELAEDGSVVAHPTFHRLGMPFFRYRQTEAPR